jgi:hypothetical protein
VIGGALEHKRFEVSVCIVVVVVDGDGDGDVVDQRQTRVSIATIRSRRWLARRWCSVSRTRSTTRASRMAAHSIADPRAIA